MTITSLFRQDGDQTNPTLCDSFGVQSTHGKPVLLKQVGNQYYFISFLARGECNRALKVFYGAFLLAEFAASGARQWRFHKGTASTGFDDPEQGRPEFFPEMNVTYTEICYIEVAPPADLGEIDPNKLFVVFEGKVVDYYEKDLVTGDLVVAGRKYSANNMLVGLHILRNHLLMPLWRFEADSALAFEAECDQEIEWIGGEGNGLLAEYFDGIAFAGGVVFSETVRYVYEDFSYGKRDAGLANPFNFSVRFSGRFKSPTSETVDFILTADSGVRLTVNGSLIIDDWFAHDGMIENYGSIALSAGVEYSIEVEYFHSGINYLGGIRLEYQTPTIARQLIAMDRLFSVAVGDHRAVKRFTAHVAFPQAVDAIVAFESVMSRAPSVHWQDVGIYNETTGESVLKVRFLVGADRASVHQFYFDPDQTIIRSNIAYNTFETYPKTADQRPSFFFLGFRDADKIEELLPQKYLPFDRPQLRQALGGYSVDLGVIPYGVGTSSEVDRIGESNMRMNSDLARYVVVRGQRDAHHVAKGDFVEVVHDIPQWKLPRLFIVIEESFSRGAAGERDFLLQAISPEFYSDTAHGRITQSNNGDITPVFSPPPIIVDLDLTDNTRILADLTVLPVISGVVTAANHPYAQILRVWWKSPVDTDWQLTDKILRPDPFSHQDSFELIGSQVGEHQIKVVSESQIGGLKLPFDQHTIYFATVTAPRLPEVVDLTLTRLADGGSSDPYFDTILAHWFRGADPRFPVLDKIREMYRIETEKVSTGQKGRDIIHTSDSPNPLIYHPTTAGRPEDANVTKLPNGSLLWPSGLSSSVIGDFSSQILLGDFLVKFKTDARLPPTAFLVSGSGESWPFTADPDANVLAAANYPMRIGQQVIFHTTGVLPAPLTTTQSFWVVDTTETEFKVSATLGGAAVTLTDEGTGVHTFFVAGYNVRLDLHMIGGLPVMQADTIGAQVPAVPTDNFAIEIRNGMGLYYRNYEGPNSIPFYRTAFGPAPYRCIVKVGFGIITGGYAQAALETSVIQQKDVHSFIYTREMRETDFGGTAPAVGDLRVRVSQVSNIPQIGIGYPSEEII